MTTQPHRLILVSFFLFIFSIGNYLNAQDDGTSCNAVGGTFITIETDTTEVTVCVGDNISDAVYAKVWEEEGDASVYVITDNEGNILRMTNAIRFEFEGTGPGTNLIYHLSTVGEISGLSEGSNISDITGCHEFSNPIKVIKVEDGSHCGCAMTVSLGDAKVICEGDEITIGADVRNSNVCTIVCSVENSLTLVEWDMDACHSITNGVDNLDFSELGPSYPDDKDCVGVSATPVNVDGGMHSCTVPKDGLGGRAMCFSGSKKCYWKDDSPDALKFSVTLDPAKSSTISGLQFYESAPERFMWYNPDFSEDIDEGPNNYPRFYGLRVTVDGEEIYQEHDIPTTNNWTLEEFDFSDNPAFKVEESTTFVFELLAYCPAWRNAITYAWDLDNIKLLGGCCEKDSVIDHVDYVWSTGETSESITVSPNESTEYSVTVTDCMGCVATKTIPVRVNEPLTADLGDDVSVCRDELPITLTHSTEGINTLHPRVEWSTGEEGESIQVSEPGTYTVTVTDGLACSDTDEINVTISEPDPISLPDAETVCEGATVALSSFEPSGKTGGVWTDSNDEVVIDVGPGTYTYTYTDANGCSVSDQITITTDDFSFSIDDQGPICEDESFDFNTIVPDGVVGDSWAVDDLGDGNYRFTGQNANGCSASADFSISIDDLSISLGDTPILCEGEEYMLSDQEPSAYTGGVWTDSEGNIAEKATPGMYTYTFTNDNGCSASDKINFIGSDFMVMEIADDSVCWGDSLLLSSLEFPEQSGGVWKNLNNDVVTYGLQDTRYRYHYFDSENGCTHIVDIKIHEKHCSDPCEGFSISVNSPEAICEDETVSLASLEQNNASGGVWTDSNGDEVSTAGIGNYTYTYTNADGCSDTAQIQVTAKDCIDPCEIFNINFTNPSAICNDATFDLTTLISTAAAGGEWTNSENNIVTVVGPGTYTYSVTTDDGCKATADVTVVGEDCTDPCEGVSITIPDPAAICSDATINLSSVVPTELAGGKWTDVDGNEVTEVSAGIYTYTLKDSNDCELSATITVVGEDCTDPCEGVSITIPDPAAICSDATINLTSVVPTELAGGKWTDVDGNEVTEVSAGIYTYTLKDSNDCELSATITVVDEDCTDPCEGVSITIPDPAAICSDSTINLSSVVPTELAGGKWTDANGNEVAEVGKGNYTYTLINSDGCQASVTITIEDKDCSPDPCEDHVVSIDLGGNKEVCADEFPYKIALGLSCNETATLAISAGAVQVEGDTISLNANEQYIVTITDANGHYVSETILLTSIDCSDPSTPCDDGNPNTENDIQIDECNCCGTPIAGQVLYVDRDADGATDGSSWTDAFTDLNEALGAANSGQEVWVADGTYIPTQDGDRDIYFNIPSGVDLYGGFAGTEENICQRDFTSTRTILSGDLAGDDKAHSTNLFPLDLLFESTEENSHYVVRNSQVTDDIKLDGIAITGGVAQGNENAGGGAILFVNDSDATIELTNVLIVQNQGAGLGGAVRINTRSATTLKVKMDRVIFLQNRVMGPALSKGAGVYYGGFEGGFIDAEMTNCVFAQNHAQDRGGAVCTDENVKAIYTNCVFAGNRASDGGAVFENNGDNESIHTNNTFYLNHADKTGGAIVNFNDFGNNTVESRNCIYFGNAVIVSISVMGPAFDNFGDANNAFSIQNCLFNEASLAVLEAEATIDDRGDNQFGVTDAQFTDPLSADFSLQSSSPAVNAGDNSFVTLSEDLARNTRIQDDTVDLGALESGENGACFTDVFELANAGVQQPSIELYEQLTIEHEDLEEYEKVEVMTYPNPSTDFINVVVNKSREEDKISMNLFDPAGGILPMQKRIIGEYSNRVEYSINVKDFSGGVYFLKTKVGRHTINKRVIVIK